MRSTIHLVSGRDALALRPLLQPLIERATEANWGAGAHSVDRAALAAAGRALVDAEPRTFAQLGQALSLRWPDAPRPDPETPVALRLVAPFDNVLLSHADTTRIMPAEHRGRVMTQNGLVSGTYLVDGFVQGTWKLQAAGKRAATLAVTPFGKTTKKTRAALTGEGERLLAFAAPAATRRTVELSAGG
jgi:hypothetical protein